MSRTKKPKDGKKPGKREPITWPPEEWPEEVKQAENAAFRAFMEEWSKAVFADMPKPQKAKIIPFPGAKKPGK